MLNNPKKPSPFLLERYSFTLQGFKFTGQYLPGKLDPSNYTSVYPTTNYVGGEETFISEELKASTLVI